MTLATSTPYRHLLQPLEEATRGGSAQPRG
jgi:hypothetical protein